ncbi:hypothetical protein OS493_005724 [Desmophyllum pertusum]|uniref:Uncharacterized protein n=1 Tax=Desmophyllum pertusum TaxID=174260 RepID=A0A9W9YFE8_9CNID|nr:hypothetical protein OS493_005724 [Desmophyllum pertusum]
MVCLLVASSSRGRIHRSSADQDYVEDNHHSAKPDEQEVMQDIEKRSPEFNPQDDFEISNEVPNDLTAVKRQCTKDTKHRGGYRYHTCKKNCCCVEHVCKKCGPCSSG